MLHHALGLRISGVAEIGTEPVMGGKANIVGCGHHYIRHHTSLQTAHPIRQHRLRHPAQLLETLPQHPELRSSLLVGGEPDKPEPRPGKHRTKHVQASLNAPIDNQRLSRSPHSWPPAPMLTLTPPRLDLGDQPTEIAR